MTTIGDLLDEARPHLAATPFDAHTREAMLILGHVLGLSEAQVIAREEEEVTPEQEELFLDLLDRRLDGEPFAYLTGEREFYGRPFQVDPRVLIPRPETEHLVEASLAEALPPAPWILDLGTGSGCIAITLALEVPGARAVAVDLSPAALAVTSANARLHGVRDRVHPVAADLFGGLDLARFDLVVGNPPYIDPADVPYMSPEVCNFEPHLALFSPEAGNGILARIVRESAGISPEVPLILEIGDTQLQPLSESLTASSLQIDRVWHDYSGKPRTVKLKRPSPAGKG